MMGLQIITETTKKNNWYVQVKYYTDIGLQIYILRIQPKQLVYDSYRRYKYINIRKCIELLSRYAPEVIGNEYLAMVLQREIDNQYQYPDSMQRKVEI
jgi:hypothetical protein